MSADSTSLCPTNNALLGGLQKNIPAKLRCDWIQAITTLSNHHLTNVTGLSLRTECSGNDQHDSFSMHIYSALIGESFSYVMEGWGW